MKICIYGLGAIGGLIAARLAALDDANLHVSAVARGETLEAVRRDGLTVQVGDSAAPTTTTSRLHAVSDRPADLGVQDVVVITVKTTALAAVAGEIAPLLGPQTAVLSTMNGVPWWYFHGLDQAPAGMKLKTVDPDGSILRAIPVSRVIGCVTHLSAAVERPGTVRVVGGNRLLIGEPTGGAESPRTQAVIDVLRRAGFDVVPCERIQRDIWFKLWGNMTVNPVSAMVGTTVDKLLDDDFVRDFLSRCMREAAAIGARIGLPIEDDPEARHAVTRKLGAFRTSMQHDVDAGRPVELDALVGAVLEIAAQVQVPAPNIETLFGLARVHARARGLY